jgi:hypothetical protein
MNLLSTHYHKDNKIGHFTIKFDDQDQYDMILSIVQNEQENGSKKTDKVEGFNQKYLFFEESSKEDQTK